MQKAVVILSGGLDSTTLLYWAKREYNVSALTFDYGSKHNERERVASKKIAQRLNVPHTIIDLPFVDELFKSDLLRSGGAIPQGHYEDDSMRKTVVPFRNGIMLAIAVGYAESIEANIVLYGAHGGDHAIYPDCRPEFLKSMSEAGRAGTYRGVEIKDPFMNLKKKDIVALGMDLHVPFELTYSCYNGGEKHCGTCGTCVERREAFQLAGVVDPTVYEL
ncbi:MAG: 7-cyano-7-deazaguanine synthase QueC [Ignavibacteriales bacterium]|nr:7-cyano-7-deazaguanine synthase QueC [Ignavibacteriales bacterium]MBI3788051.1 7-cyano-7-deazaguanine synthase QueC [Ignavibacteriales bacterium]